MRVLTWNVYKDNRRLHKVFNFLKNGKFDVLCLQELPLHATKELESLGAYRVLEDASVIYKDAWKEPERMCSAIISSFPIHNYGVVRHKGFYEEKTPRDIRYADFKADSLYVDIETEGRKLRIFNVHFKCVAGPHHRLSQLRDVLERFHPERENIVCGDFNAFGHPMVNPFVAGYFGYRMREWLVNEKKLLAKAFEHHGLQNPFRNSVTFLKFPMQLDYILVPEKTRVRAQKRFLSSHGSDHLPLSVDI